jgi:putative ABC transport system permease protein
MPRAKFVGQLLQDAGYGVRMLRRRPGATAIIVLSLALGIGANTIVFSMVNALFLRALPYPDPDRLVAVWFTPPNDPDSVAPSSPGSCLDFPEVSRGVFHDVGCYLPVSGNVSDPALRDSAPEQLNGETLSHSITQVIGVRPALGRWFTPDEDKPGTQRVILISHGFWQQHFNSSPDVLGKTLRVADFSGDDSPSTIVGVMPEGFSVDGGTRTDYFIPLRNSGRGRRSPVRNRLVIARLEPGVTVAQAQAAMNTALPKLVELSPMNKGWGVKVMPLIESRVNGLQSPMGILQGVAALVLLIACANVGGLLLAQGMSRQREIAVRTAVGSPRARIVRQLLTESVVLALIGTALTLLVLWRGMPIVATWLSPLVNGVSGVSLDGRLLVFTIVVSVLTALLFGILPALQASRTDLTTAFKASDRSTTSAPSKLRLRSTFVIVQIATAVVLLTGAGLLVNTLIKLTRIDNAGFNAKGLTTFQMNFTGQEFFHQTGKVTPSGSLEFALTERIDVVASDIRQRIRALPGVVSVTSEANGMPLGGARIYPFAIAGRGPSSDRDGLQALWRPIAPGYFRTLEAPVLQGREFAETDRRDSVPVALVNAAMAKRFWPNENPIGQSISVQFFNDVPRQIVGIVGDIRQNQRALKIDPQMYVPYAQLPTLQEGRTAFGLESMNFLIRSRVPLEQWLPGATAATVAADPLHAMANVVSIEQFVANQSTLLRQYVTLLTVFSGIALLLAMVGVYGVMTHSVTQRTGEIGIRVAFGAQARNVLALVLRQGVTLIVIGIAIGAAAALGLTRLLQGLLWGVKPTDPATYATVMTAIAAVSLMACLVPAYRALKVDPLTAMRQD